MTGHPVTGAIPVTRCEHCVRIIVPCTAPACIGHGAVHLMSRLHRCAGGLTVASPVTTRMAGAAA